MATLLTLTAAELDAVLKAYKEGITEAMAKHGGFNKEAIQFVLPVLHPLRRAIKKTVEDPVFMKDKESFEEAMLGLCSDDFKDEMDSGTHPFCAHEAVMEAWKKATVRPMPCIDP